MKLYLLTLVFAVAAASERQRRFLLLDDDPPTVNTPGEVAGVISWDLGTGPFQVKNKDKSLEAIQKIYEAGQQISQLSLWMYPVAHNFRLYYILESQGSSDDLQQLKSTGQSMTELHDNLDNAARHIYDVSWALQDAIEEGAADLRDVMERSLKTAGWYVANLGRLLDDAEQAATNLAAADADKKQEIETSVLRGTQKLRSALDSLVTALKKLIKEAGIEAGK